MLVDPYLSYSIIYPQNTVLIIKDPINILKGTPKAPRNGGTSRGRADGFDLEALPKLAKLRGKGTPFSGFRLYKDTIFGLAVLGLFLGFIVFFLVFEGS